MTATSSEIPGRNTTGIMPRTDSNPISAKNDMPRSRKMPSRTALTGADAELDQIYRVLLHKVSDYEKGPMLRLFVWLPMCLQLLKVALVRGALITQILGFIFFISWLVVELLLDIAEWLPLQKSDRYDAVLLSKDFRYPIGAKVLRSEGIASSTLSTGFSRAGLVSSTMIAVLNFGLVGRMFASVLLPAQSTWIGSILLCCPLLFLMACVISPLFLMVPSSMALLFWWATGLRQRLGPLPFEKSILDEQCLLPASLSLASAMMCATMYAGIYLVCFDCAATCTPPHFEWLG